MENGHALIMLLHGRPHREALTAIAEANRLDIPIIMMLGLEDSVLRRDAAACLFLPRAKNEGVALHAPSLVAMETLALALSAARPERTLETLERMVELRTSIRPHKRCDAADAHEAQGSTHRRPKFHAERLKLNILKWPSHAVIARTTR